MLFTISSILAFVAAVQTVSAISKISTVGSKFFTEDENQFYIKGIAYQLTEDDPLINTDQCKLDAKQMQDLGANTIRVYHVDPNGDHKGCMSAFADVGIYLFVDLDTFSTWLNAQFDNTAGVFVGNEVLNTACGETPSESLDFFSLNAYEWCGADSSYMISGYSQLQANASGYSIPIFFSETGCTAVRPRTFQDQSAILGPQMDGTWSGAIVYEWIQEANDYGLISYGPSAAATATDAVGDYTRSGTPTPISPDYSNLKSQWATLSPTGVKLSDYSPSASKQSPPACPVSTPDGWLVNGNVALPTVGQTLERNAPTTATSTPSATVSATGASATPTKGTANGGREIAGMSIGLAGVMLGFIVWL
ncbi:MAG: hypothetical protein Q9187_001801 [Circinaria calcarea]